MGHIARSKKWTVHTQTFWIAMGSGCPTLVLMRQAEAVRHESFMNILADALHSWRAAIHSLLAHPISLQTAGRHSQCVAGSSGLEVYSRQPSKLGCISSCVTVLFLSRRV